MSLRRRITLVSAAAVAVAVVLASALTYALTSRQLTNQVDRQLHDRSRESGQLARLINLAPPGSAVKRLLSRRELDALRRNGRPGAIAGLLGGAGLAPGDGLPDGHTPAKPLAQASGSPPAATLPGQGPGNQSATSPGTSGNPFPALPPRPNEVRGYQQVIDASGHVIVRSSGGLALPVDAHTLALATSGGRPYLRTVHADGVHLRVLASSLGPGQAVQFAQPLSDVDHLLGRLRVILLVLDAGGIALAALLGLLVAGAAVTPVKRLTQATEHVTRTRDLSRRIEPTGEDEISRLAVSFNAMLDALEGSMNALDASVSAQRQLVADASHELRTPVTSLRTNIEILQQATDMSDGERRRLLADVVEQIEELTLLMNDLIDLARGDEPQQHAEDVRLDLLAEGAVARARRHSPDTRFELALEPTLVTGVPARLDRAINNLLDNAVKYSPSDHPVEVILRGGELLVRDHGHGISEQDLPHVFDRFYRGAEARARPGSGLGLAIVRQVATSHGGSVVAERPPGGGTLMRLRLAGAAAPDAAGEVDGAATAASESPAAIA